MRRLRSISGVVPWPVLLPFAPVILLERIVSQARQRKRRAHFREAASISSAAVAHPHRYTLTFVDGASLDVDLDTVEQATWEAWGTGVNGSAYDIGLSLDSRLLIRFDGWVAEYKPLYEVLIERGVLPRDPPERIHPDEGSGYGGVVAVLVALVELLIVAIIAHHARRAG